MWITKDRASKGVISDISKYVILFYSIPHSILLTSQLLLLFSFFFSPFPLKHFGLSD